MNKNNIFIYALIDPRNDNIKYIGATTIGKERYSRHVNDYYLKKPTLKNNWIKSLKKQNFLPKMEILEFCKKEELKDLEEFYITYFKFLGFELLNHLDGGYGIKPTIKTTEQRKREASLQYTKYPIINLETREVFECIYDVLKKYPNLTYTNLRSCLQRPKRSKSCKGMYFSYLTAGLDVELELHERKKNNHGKHCKKKIKELTTGLIFDSVIEAAKYLKINSTNISHRLNGREKSTGNYRFEYIS